MDKYGLFCVIIGQDPDRVNKLIIGNIGKISVTYGVFLSSFDLIEHPSKFCGYLLPLLIIHK